MKMKILLYLMVAIIATSGTAMAYNGDIWNADGTSTESNPIVVQPDTTQFLSFHMDTMIPADLNQPFNYSSSVTVVSGPGLPGDLIVELPPTVTPSTDPYLDLKAINLTATADAREDTVYRISVTAGGQTVETDTTQRTIEVPEFPTVALPVAAIIGLAFIFMRRKEE